MAEIKIKRYDPRKDKEALEALVKDFEYRSIYPIDIEQFAKEIGARVLDLKLRNSVVLATEEDQLVGAGFFTIWKDNLGNTQCYVHDVVTRKENSFKKGIEETVLRELFKYIKNTMKIDKVGFFVKKNDSNFQSLLMKMQIKKSDLDFYEHIL
jgi:hypothetical protein